MRPVFKVLLAVGLVGLASWAAAAEPAAAGGAAAGKIRILLTTGGHGFEQQPFYALFDGMADVQYTKAEMPRDADLLKPGLQQQLDVLVMYDMAPPGKLTPAQQQAFVDLLQAGLGVVSLHHNLGAYRDWPEFSRIIGGKYIFQAGQYGGRQFAVTPWKHGQDIPIVVADKQHPITRGVSDFTIHDETYGPFYVEPDVHVLLKTDHPQNNPALAWTHTYGRSRLAYLQLGHDHTAYENPNYARLVHQAIQWAAARTK